MPRRRATESAQLRQVKAANIFDCAGDRWAARSPAAESDGEEMDDNITRLLSESDTSMDRSMSMSMSMDGDLRARGRGKGRPSSSLFMSTPFATTDLGTPLAATGSPSVMDDDEEEDGEDLLCMDIACTSSSPLQGEGELLQLKRRLLPSSSSSSHPHSPCYGEEEQDTSGESSFSLSSLSLMQQQQGSSSAHKKARPLPDPSAFDGHQHQHQQHPLRQHPSLSPGTPCLYVCPPTPQRTPNWQQQQQQQTSSSPMVMMTGTPYSSSSSSVLDLRDFPSGSGTPLGLGPLPLPLTHSHHPHGHHPHGHHHRGHIPLHRQNSLGDTKVLLAQEDDGEGEGDDLRPSGTGSGSSGTSRCCYADFEVDGRIGDGNFAEVFAVRLRNGGVPFAVKKMKQQFRSRRGREHLLGEVTVMKTLGRAHCAHLLPFVQAWQEDGYFYVQLGLARGGCLKALVSRCAAEGVLLPEGTLWHVLHDVAVGLAHVHACGIVHLDIKPANLLLSDGLVMIADFGMAAAAGSAEDGLEGDTRYMAPELLEYTAPRLPSADLFSLGLSLYEMAYDQQRLLGGAGGIGLPAEGPQWRDLREGRIPPLHRPAALLALMHALLSPRPEGRPTASEVLRVQEVDQLGGQGPPDELLLSAQLQMTSGHGHGHHHHAYPPPSASACTPLSLSQSLGLSLHIPAHMEGCAFSSSAALVTPR